MTCSEIVAFVWGVADPIRDSLRPGVASLSFRAEVSRAG
jgi:hypothetical protein